MTDPLQYLIRGARGKYVSTRHPDYPFLVPDRARARKFATVADAHGWVAGHAPHWAKLGYEVVPDRGEPRERSVPA